MAASDKTFVDFVELSDEEKKIVDESYGELSTLKDLVRTEPRTVTLSRSFTRNIQRVITMQIRASDVWVVTPPKCGTTWLQEMTWLIRNGADTEGVKTFLFDRSPFVEYPMVVDLKQELVDKFFDDLEMSPSPRLLKTHLPFELLPPDLLNVCKVIFCCRNIKDAVVSLYHHERLLQVHNLVTDNFESYATNIIRPALYIWGGYFEMLESGWRRKSNPNLLFLWYEDIMKEQKKVIRDVMRHIDVDLTEEQVNTIDEQIKFDNYKKTCTLNTLPHFEGMGQFMRKGVVGDHVSYFSRELSMEWDEWIRTKLDQIGVLDEKIRQMVNISKD
eukprot:GFUD01015816.1.p1 GENE.GFUD01015816.1~~GFUD01015816.1.p1  ORF type:complete len:330 (+),score=74.86 GFUD01015816.1:291-1280(+)